jgi:hypothetical protein
VAAVLLNQAVSGSSVAEPALSNRETKILLMLLKFKVPQQTGQVM